MRLFFALPLSIDTTLRISDWRDRYAPCDARPVPAANFHITLAFAGELPERALEFLCDATDSWVNSHQPSAGDMLLDRVGFWAKPGIFWLGPSAYDDALAELAKKLQSLVVSAGARRERRKWEPHITLYRGCNLAPPAPDSEPSIPCHYDLICLFESQRARNGMIYRRVAEWQLARHRTR
ncbi:MAG: RNA 2',3'-cyclic phosphodiesterase [Halioglobus sp.]|nr:RNA 2',3'-cyclic phosphodiesterase [Halioglobus sp.]